MATQQWKYQIGTGKTPVVLSLGMTVLFGSLSLWLHKAQNPAYLFCDILSVIMAVLLLITVYRLLFYKVLIGKDGFYYQTQIGNGMYHNYSELNKAWFSAGQNLSGHQSKYCHFETADGKVYRFAVYYNDETAAQYLVRRTQTETAGRTAEEEHAQQYRIDGKAGGVIGLVSAFVVVGLVCFFSIPMLQLGGIGVLMGALSLLLACLVATNALFTYFFFQIKIEKDGFYCQTNPFNGTYYLYKDITHCREVKRVYRYRRNATRNHYFYLYFTDRYGKTRRFQYEQDIYDYQIKILKERINKK